MCYIAFIEFRLEARWIKLVVRSMFSRPVLTQLLALTSKTITLSSPCQPLIRVCLPVTHTVCSMRVVIPRLSWNRPAVGKGYKIGAVW
jgi:hypothetical protein